MGHGVTVLNVHPVIIVKYAYVLNPFSALSNLANQSF